MTVRLTRRNLLRVVPLSVAASAAPAVSTAATAAPAAQAPADEQVLRLASSVPVLSGIFPAGFASAERIVLSNVFLPLLVRDDQHQLHPGLLESYEANADFTQYTLKVDPKAKWSDGSPLTARDIKLGWEANLAPVPEGVALTKYTNFIMTGMDPIVGAAELAAGEIQELASVQVVDDLTLTVQLSRSDPIFPQRLALPNMSVMRVDQWAEDPFIFEKPEVIVSGPFKVAKYDKQANDYVFEPNPHWWGKKPTIARIEFKAKVDESTEYALWQNDQIDVGFWTGDVLKQLYATDADKASLLPYPGIGLGVLFNTTKEPLSDINLRKALAYGADYNAIVKAVAGDTQLPALGMIPSELPCFVDRESTYPFDVAMAKEFIAQSKYGSSENVPKLEFGNSIQAPWPELQAVIEQWRSNLGLRVEYVTDTSIPSNEDAKRYDIVRFSIGSIIPDTVSFLVNALIPGAGVFRYQSGYDNPQIRQLLDEAAKTPTSDPKHCELNQQAQEIFIADAPGVPIEHVTYQYWVKPWVVGWKNNIDLSPYTIADIYVAQR